MKENKNIIILVVLMVVAVIVLIHGATAPSKKKRAASPRAQAVKAQDSAERAPAAVRTGRRAARTKIAALRRSPFTAKGTGGSGSSGLVLNGVISEGNVFKAVIGDTIVKKGDAVGAYKVVDIKKDCCTVTDGTSTIDLKLER